MGILFLLFTVVPVAELYLLFEVSDIIGGWDTILLVIVTGIVGAYMARSQGLSIIMNTQKQLAQGQIPTDHIVHGFLVFIGGILLVTPGFVTDIFGLSLVFPLTRVLYINSVKKYFKNKITSGNIHFYTNVNGEWHSSEDYRDVTHTQRKVNEQPAKVIDIDNYRSKD